MEAVEDFDAMNVFADERYWSKPLRPEDAHRDELCAARRARHFWTSRRQKGREGEALALGASVLEMAGVRPAR